MTIQDREPSAPSAGRDEARADDLSLHRLSVVFPKQADSAIDLRSLEGRTLEGPERAPDHETEAPRARRLRRLVTRPASSTTFIYLADTLVLFGYAAFVPEHWKLLAGLWLLTVLAFWSAGLYKPRLNLSVLDDLPKMVRRIAVADVFVAVALGRLHGNESLRPFFWVAIGGLCGHIAVRGLAYAGVRWARRTHLTTYRTVVVGSGEVSRKLVAVLDADASFGLQVVGYVDDQPSPQAGSGGWTYLGRVEALPQVMDGINANVLVVGFMCARDVTLSNLMRSHRLRPSALFVVPRLFEVGRRTKTGDHLGGIPILRMSTARLDGVQLWPKRVFDIVFSALSLVLLSPALLAIAIAVRIDGGPGVIFKQERVGRDGRLIELWKFRSMRPATADEANTQWSIADDDRVSRVGRVLRRTSIDELPQLVNILRGDMTFVGPRPERPHFVEQFTTAMPHYEHRHRVQVGLTGLAQVNGLRGDTSIDDRARFDNYYIENWSLWLDIKVILRTVSQVAFARGA